MSPRKKIVIMREIDSKCASELISYKHDKKSPTEKPGTKDTYRLQVDHGAQKELEQGRKFESEENIERFLGASEVARL